MSLLNSSLQAALLGSDVSYNAFGKDAFHTAGKRLLKRIADELGLIKEQFYLRSNHGGIAVSGEITLHTDTLYLQLSQGALFRGATYILYRRCDGRKDYGSLRHTNHFIEVARLLDDGVAKRFMLNLQNIVSVAVTAQTDHRLVA